MARLSTIIDNSYQYDTSNLTEGPSSATDNAIPRYDGTGGDTLQNSGIVIET